jgi:hypothetical protein
MKVRQRVEVREALRYNGANLEECKAFVKERNGYIYTGADDRLILGGGADGNRLLEVGDVIIKPGKYGTLSSYGKAYISKAGDFDETYEIVEE